ncbi:amino acid adenylation domain-containing protein [Streptomyces graminilatus]|uniref:amino acid adenylation domain-containing protein n=1 Tax=Streptomyces graminilatus TaxID=1464070 RepID=UPI0006E3C202|nr:amino acid adenylation domain-containing protein [Streptomyces graminilatus]
MTNAHLPSVPAGSTEGPSDAMARLVLPPDHRCESDRRAQGTRTEQVVLLAGDDARALFRWCRANALPPTRTVRRLAEHLAERWNQYAVAEPGVKARDIIASAARTAPESVNSLQLAVHVPPDDAPGGEVRLSTTWDEGLLDHRTTTAFTDALRTLVTGWLVDPDADLAGLPLVSPDSVARLLALGDGGTPAGARYRTVPEAILGWAQSHPLRPAVRFDGSTVTYGDLVRRAADTAAGLKAAGIARGDRVLLYGSQSDATVAGMVACHLVGASYVSLDVESPVARLAQVAAGTGAGACLWADDSQEPLPADFLPAGTPVIRIGQDSATESTPLSPAPPEPSTAAYVLFSSGSTGVPKGIEVSHESLGHFSREINAAYAMTPADRVLAFARPVFDVSVFEVFATLAAGAQVVIPDADARMDPMLLTDFIRDERITLAELPPALLPLLDPAELPSLRLVSVGGEAVPGALVNEWASAERELWNGYGPTEATVAVTLQKLTGEWTAPPPIGRPIGGCTAYVVDDRLTLRPWGAVGELCVSGPSLATGYLNDPVRTAAAFVELPQVPGTRVYRTGDLVRWRGDGALDYLGRIDRQVKVNGFRVELTEVEGVLASATGVRQAAVEMVEAAGGGRVLGALVVGDAELDSRTVLDEVRDALPPYAVPGRLVATGALPLTANGKVDRAVVRRMLAGH